MAKKLRDIFHALKLALNKEMTVSGENYTILKQVVLIGVYGNWLVSLLDRLSFQTENFFLYCIQSLGFLTALLSFIMFFFDISKFIYFPIVLTVIGTFLAILVESILGNYTSTQMSFFWLFGMLFWLLLSYLEIQRMKQEK